VHEGSPIKSLIRQISSSSQQSLQQDEEEDDVKKKAAPKQDAEQVTKGSVDSSVYIRYWRMGASIPVLLLLLGLFFLTQIAVSGSDVWVAYWTTIERKRYIANYYEQANNTNTSELDNSELGYSV
jgi:hypothetical protein